MASGVNPLKKQFCNILSLSPNHRIWTNSCLGKASLTGHKCDWQVLRPDHWTNTHFPSRIHKKSDFNNYTKLKLSRIRPLMHLHRARILFLVLVFGFYSMQFGIFFFFNYYFWIVLCSGEATTFEPEFSILTSLCPSLCKQHKVLRQFPSHHWALEGSDCVWTMTSSILR